ncbi:MAG TPA: hypothetical protein VJ327_06705 [Patescibacteria group bacterium]|nr:hypothetical protein [Patescibacteria group bacterium]
METLKSGTPKPEAKKNFFESLPIVGIAINWIITRYYKYKASQFAKYNPGFIEYADHL